MGDLIDDTTKAIDIVNRENRQYEAIGIVCPSGYTVFVRDLQYAIRRVREERDYWQRELNRLEALDPDRNRDA